MTAPHCPPGSLQPCSRSERGNRPEPEQIRSRTRSPKRASPGLVRTPCPRLLTGLKNAEAQRGPVRRLAFRVSEGVASAWPSPGRLGALRTLSHPGILGCYGTGELMSQERQVLLDATRATGGLGIWTSSRGLDHRIGIGTWRLDFWTTGTGLAVDQWEGQSRQADASARCGEV